MKMPASATLSVRLPDETRLLLEKAAKQTRRSRAFLVKEALELYLVRVMEAQAEGSQQTPLDKLRAFKGFGAKLHGPRTMEDIDAQVREFRGDE